MGEDEDGPDGQAFGGFAGGDAEEADFGGGVEAQAEEQADGIHLPTVVYEFEEAAKKAAKKTAPPKDEVDVFYPQSGRLV